MNRISKFFAVFLLVIISISIIYYYVNLDNVEDPSEFPSTRLGYSVSVSNSTYYLTSNDSGEVLVRGDSFSELMNDFFDSVPYGETLYVEPGLYVLDEGIVGASGVRVVGLGHPVFNCSLLPEDSAALSFLGFTDDGYRLQLDAEKGFDTITVRGSGWKTGDLLFLKSSDVFKNNNMGQRKGELQFVRSVNGAELGLELPLFDSYSEESSQISRVNSVRDVIITNIEFTGVSGKNQVGVIVRFGQNVTITSCFFSSLESYAVDFSNCLDCSVEACVFKDSDRDGLGYGVQIEYASYNCTVSSSIFYRCRHAVSIGGGSGNGIPRHLLVSNNLSFNASAANFDCHNTGEDIVFSDNVVSGGYQGIAAGMYSGLVTRNLIVGVSNDGVININRNADVVRYSDNTIKDAGSSGFTLAARNTIIDSNLIVNYSLNGIHLVYPSNCTTSNNILVQGVATNNNGADILIRSGPGIVVADNEVVVWSDR